jgi:hypothetical protein
LREKDINEVIPPGRTEIELSSLFLLAFCAANLFWMAAYPFSRAFLLTQINYNEGWNVYNAQKVAEHQPLYPSAYGWTSVNYPALSFHLVAALGRFTSDYLFTARILSLACLCLCGVLAGLIVWHTTRSELAAWLTGMFLVAMFCAIADAYVGMDDPQMLAQAFFLAGMYVYLRGDRRGWALELTALLFVLGGNVKHSLIEFPLAVLSDLLLSSPRRALRFAVSGTLMAAISVVLTSQIEGAAYVSCLLAPRSYSAFWALVHAYRVLRPILPFTVAALWMARYCWKNPSQRVLALLLFYALAVNTFFSGGSGVAINSMFGSILAIALLIGVFWGRVLQAASGRLRVLSPTVVCAIFFLWLAVPMVISGKWRTDVDLQRSRDGEQPFVAGVAYLRQQPGPALCESLLLCYYAGKPYLYDPFNATRFIYLGRLDANVIVDHLRNREYGAIQLDDSVEQNLSFSSVPPDSRFERILRAIQQYYRPGYKEVFPEGHFALPILRAIQQYYRPGFKNEGGIIYIPRSQDTQMPLDGLSSSESFEDSVRPPYVSGCVPRALFHWQHPVTWENCGS